MPFQYNFIDKMYLKGYDNHSFSNVCKNSSLSNQDYATNLWKLVSLSHDKSVNTQLRFS